MNSEKTIRNKFTVISFISSILVIYIHAFNLEVYDIGPSAAGLGRIVYAFETYMDRFLETVVPLFFFISGILFFRTFRIASLGQKWKKRVFSILLPYIIWCTLYYLYMVLCTNIPAIHAMMGDEKRVFLTLGEWIDHLWMNEYYTLWFLKNLIIFIAMAPLIWLFLNDHFGRIPSGLLFLCIFLFFRDRIDILDLDGIEPYLIGSYIGLNLRKYLSYKNRTVSCLSAVYVLFMFLTSFRYMNVLMQTLFFISVWFCLDFIGALEDKDLPWWMYISFFTYVAHDVFLEAMEKIILIVFGKGAIFALGDYLLMPLLTELLLIGMTGVMMKHFGPLWKVLTGGRGRDA